MKSFWNKLFAKQPVEPRTATCGTFRLKQKNDTSWEGGRDTEYANKLISMQRRTKQKKAIEKLCNQK